MQPIKTLVLLISLWMIGTSAIAQEKGFIRGQVFDGETGLTVIGARVRVEGQAVGAMTDLDGKFSVSIAPGTYDVFIAFTGMDTLQLPGVEVKAGEVTLFENLKMSSFQAVDSILI